MNWSMIVALTISGLVFVGIVIFAAESDRRNAKRPRGRASPLTRYYPWRRDDDQLLVPLDDSEIRPAPPAPESYPDHKQAFDLLHQSRELEDMLSYTPSHRRPIAWSVVWILVSLAFVALATVARLESTAACVFVLLGAIPLITGISDLLKFESSPLERLPAVVVDKSRRPYAGFDLMSGGVILLVCIETQDGHLQHYHIGLKLFRQIEREDIGVAYIRGEHMLDFRKVTLKDA